MFHNPRVEKTTANTKENWVKPVKSRQVVHHPDLCRGCGICELACSLYHEGACSPTLSRIHIIRDIFELSWSGAVCHQCDWPDCYFACPVNAIKFDSKTGGRYIEETLCTGCGICVKACPFMPKDRIIRSKTVGGRLKFFKCDICKDRENGPICIEYCPRNALSLVPAGER